MPEDAPPDSRKLSGISACVSLALVGFAYWVAGPGTATFNALNDRMFGRYYTAGAILMIGFYGLAFFGVVGIALAAAILSWIRKEEPRWLVRCALVVALVAPVVAIKMLRGR